MSNLTSEQLTELTELVNERLQEFNLSGQLFFEVLSRGQVRLYYGIFEAWFFEKHLHAKVFVKDEVHIVSPPAQPALHPEGSREPILDGAAATVHQPASVTVKPGNSLGAPLATVPNENGNGAHTHHTEAAPIRHVSNAQIIAELQSMAMGGKMPTMTQWDESKPATWPGAGAFTKRFNKGWAEIAKEAGLELKYKISDGAAIPAPVSSGPIPIGDFH